MGLMVFICKKSEVTFREPPPRGCCVSLGFWGRAANPQLSQPAQSPGENAPNSPSSWILPKLELKCVVQQNLFYLCGSTPWGLLPVHEALAFCGFTKSSLDPHTCGPVGLIGPRDGD